jgi:ribose transport system permease protein
LGGVSLAGGIGNMSGTFLGVLIIGVLNNGLIQLDIPSYWQSVAQGLVLLTAVGMDQFSRKSGV